MQYFLEWAYSVTTSYGWSIILLSIAVNIVLLPIIWLAERFQERERLLQRCFEPKLEEFSRAFTGATRYAVIRAYYRQQNYHPVFALRVSLGLMLQIPFFLAAYQLLSYYNDFAGQSFAFLNDLNKPDQLLWLLGEPVHFMPFVMTGINLLAGTFYSRKLLAKERQQIYILSLLFLILLYQAPSALLLYWTCNNMFSLVKNIFPLQVSAYGIKTKKTAIVVFFRKLISVVPQPLHAIIYSMRFLQVVGLLLFVERMIFFKEVDSSTPEAVLALYLATGYVLAVHLLQWGLNLWRKNTWSTVGAHQPSQYQHIKRIGWQISFGFSLLMPLLLIVLMIFSLQDFRYFSNAMWDRLSLLGLSLITLCCSFLHEWFILSDNIPPPPLDKKKRPSQHSYKQSVLPLAPLTPWAALLLGAETPNQKQAIPEWTLYGNILCGNLLIFLLVPLTFVASSPSEFPEILQNIHRNLLPGFAISTTTLSLLAFLLRKFGTRFAVSLALYRLLQLLSFSFILLAFINVFFRPGDYGTLSDFVWDQPDRFYISTLQRLIDVILIFCLAVWPFVLWKKRQFIPMRRTTGILLATSLLLSSYHYTYLQNYFASRQSKLPITEKPKASSSLQSKHLLQLSRRGHNIIVFMMDRFIGGFIPEIMQSYPELKYHFRDFTWYANTISLGPTTLVSLPSILGGYDYSVFNINRRVQQGTAPNLVQEVNRSYLVLPTIFQQQGYHSVIFNPQYANYAARGDLGIFAGTGIEAKELGASYSPRWFKANNIAFEDLGGNSGSMLAMLGLFRSAMPSLRPSIYDEAEWLGVNSSATGKYRKLVNEWSALYYLPEEITAVDNGKPVYLFFNNLVTHEPQFISRNLKPSLQPIHQQTTDEQQRFRSLSGTQHFYTNAGALKLISRVLKKLRDLEIYHNTTVVILSDHSYDIYDPTMAHTYPNISDPKFNPGYLHPLLLYKAAGQQQENLAEDWNSFMSVADLSALLQRELGFSMNDPFTGKDIGWQRSQKEKANGLTTTVTAPWNIKSIKVQVDIPHAWKITDNIFEAKNWQSIW